MDINGGKIMDDRDWLILSTLYNEKNITKAAKMLFISQPALTKRLKLMEKEFGVKIVNRERRGVQFTEQGEYLADCSKEMVDRIEEIKESVLNINGKARGLLKIGVSNFFTKNKLPHILKLFKEQYPNVEFKVITDWSSNIFNLIYNKGVHVAFVRGDFSWKGESYLLSEENICIASKKDIDIDNLPKLPQIAYNTDYLLKTMIDNWWRENYLEPPLVSIEVDQSDTCKEMIINGLGYGIIPSAVVDNLRDVHKINIVDKEGKPLLRRTWMLYNEEHLEINMGKAFVNFVKKLSD